MLVNMFLSHKIKGGCNDNFNYFMLITRCLLLGNLHFIVELVKLTSEQVFIQQIKGIRLFSQ